MNSWLLLCWLLPLSLALVVLFAAARAALHQVSETGAVWLRLLPVIAPIPGLIASVVLSPTTTLSLPWLLMGSEFALNALDLQFLLAASLVYLGAGIYLASPNVTEGSKPGFVALFMLAMAGNLLLICAADPVIFYLGFTLMSLSAYGLVIFKRGKNELFAGKVYLIMAIVGEMLLFSAFILYFQRTGLPSILTPGSEHLVQIPAIEQGLLEQWLFVAGFGIKGGLLGLHMWLPLAHPAAPVPASAVLSGVMIKAALVGMIRYLPIGEQSALVGEGLLLFALVGAALAAMAGIVQRDPKVILAYSSVAKMGMAMALVAIMLLEPETVALILPLLGAFVFYHGVCKAALFLGVGWYKQMAWNHAGEIVRLVLLAVPAWILIGAPFGAGAVMKANLSAALESLGGFAGVPALSLLLDIAPILLFLSTLLVCRLLWVLYQQAETAKQGTKQSDPQPPGHYISGVNAQFLSVIFLVSVAILVPLSEQGTAMPKLYDLMALCMALVIAAIVVMSGVRLNGVFSSCMPPGDILILVRRQLVSPAGPGAAENSPLFSVVFRSGLHAVWDRLARIIGPGLLPHRFYHWLFSSVSTQRAWMFIFVVLLIAIMLPGIGG